MPPLWRVAFCAPSPGQSGQRKKHRKKVFAIFKRKIIIITYMTFVRMNYVFEFTFLLRTSISLVNTWVVHFCFLDAMYEMPWLHGMHNSQIWKQVDLLVLQGSGSPSCEQIKPLFFRPVVCVTLFLFVNINFHGSYFIVSKTVKY